MTIEDLKILKNFWEDPTSDIFEKDIDEMITELINAEIKRQSVTDDEVQNLIDLIADNMIVAFHSDDEGTDIDTNETNIIITALQQMKKESCGYCSEEYNQLFEVKSIRFHSSDDYTTHKIEPKFCPNCGRKL